MRLHTFAVCLLLGALAPHPAISKDMLQDLRARMDKAASGFNAMTADVQYVTHTDVINDDSTETGTVAMKKVPPGEVQGLVEFVTPDKRTVTFEKRKIQIYYPKMKTLQIWNLDQHGEQLDKFLMIGFGTSGSELAKDYDMTVLGTETVKGQQSPAIRLQLVPKSAEARQYVKKLELWIPSEGDPYPFREKISQPSNDYRLVTYSDLKINPPLKADAMRLRTPAGVKTEYPGK
jgi:outer membrane lipoprotein-sorting protein